MDNNLNKKAEKEFKDLFSNRLTRLISFIVSGFTVIGGIKGWISYQNSSKMADLYGIPRYYFFEDNVYGILNKLIFFLLIVCINFLPLILKKLIDRFKFNITKIDILYYTILMTLYTFSSIFFMAIGIVITIEIKYILFLHILIVFIALILSYLMGSRTYKFLYFCFLNNKIKNDDGKDEQDEGYKFITFDFNGGKNLNTIKSPTKYKVSIGLEISDVIKYVEEYECVNKIKKGDTKLAYWSFGKDTDKIYKNQKISENFDENTTLYAQYSDKNQILIKLVELGNYVRNIFSSKKNKLSILKSIDIENAKCKTKNYMQSDGKGQQKIKINFTIISLLVFIPIFFGCIYIDFHLANPKNKLKHEFVTLNNNQEKIIVGYYKDKAILMDYEVFGDKSDKNQVNGKLKNIKIIKGKFILKSLDGEKIELRKSKILDEEK